LGSRGQHEAVDGKKKLGRGAISRGGAGGAVTRCCKETKSGKGGERHIAFESSGDSKEKGFVPLSRTGRTGGKKGNRKKKGTFQPSAWRKKRRRELCEPKGAGVVYCTEF